MAFSRGYPKRLPGFLRFIKKFSPILRKQKVLIFGSFLALFLEVFFLLLEPWPLKFIIDCIITTEHSGERLIFPFINTLNPTILLTYAALGIFVIAWLKGVSSYFNKVGFALIGNRFLTEVRCVLYRHLHNLSLRFHNNARSGDLVVRIISDMGMLKEVSVTAILPLLGNLFVLAGMTSMMFWLNWQLTFLALTTMPLFWLTTLFLGRKIHHVSRKQRKREGTMAAKAAESIGGIKTVQALSLDEMFSKSFSKQNTKSLKDGVQAKRLEASLERTVDILIALATALVLWFGARLVLRNELSPGELLVFLFYIKSAFRPVRNFAKFTGRLAKAGAAGERILEVLEEKPDVYDMAGSVAAPVFRGEVRFDKVCFSYEQNHKVLENINLKISAGQCIALVGASGNGKSTLASLVLRLYDPTFGQVMIDGKDIREYTLTSLRSQISVVLQDTILFAVSVRDNIEYGAPNASFEEIVTAARLANADKFIEAMPEGYDTIIGERGVTLSNGQRQRIAVARAAIRKATILILDEPTTGLDEKNEQEVIKSLERLSQQCTTFLITHNLDYASRADLIAYLENGSILECGTHEELIRANGYYAAMYQLERRSIKKKDSEISNVIN